MNSLASLDTAGPTVRLFVGFAAVLSVLTLVVWAARRATPAENCLLDPVRRLMTRVRGLWGIVIVFSLAVATGGLGSVLVFAATSFLLLREFITIAPTRRADHRALFWAFFVILPLQYIILAVDWYGLFVIFIPVYAFLFLPTRMAAGDDPVRFLERAAKVQWALMICVYCVSYAPALMKLSLPGQDGAGVRLLLFLCIVAQANDAIHEFVDATVGRHPVSRRPGCTRTVDGLLAGAAAGAGLGATMAWATPMSVAYAAGMGALASLLGSAGQLCLSVIRAERGREGVVVVHRRRDMMSRVISLCFAAPVFFHIVRFVFGEADMVWF